MVRLDDMNMVPDCAVSRRVDSAGVLSLDCIFTRPAPGHRTGPGASKPVGQVTGLVGAGHVPAAASVCT